MSNLALPNNQLTESELSLIKATVAKGATDAELNLFLYRCRDMGLNPLRPGQIHFVKYGNSPGTIIIGRDGFRSRALATGKHAGTKVGVIRASDGQCVGAWCEVYRGDWREPARAEVSLAEYNTGKPQWVKMPETMIQKVAEVHALRMAFPDELSGLYSQEEMDQAQPMVRDIVTAQDDPGDYVCNFGRKFMNKRLKDAPLADWESYIEWLENEAQKKGQELQGEALYLKMALARFAAHLSEEVDESPGFGDEPWPDSAADYARPK